MKRAAQKRMLLSLMLGAGMMGALNSAPAQAAERSQAAGRNADAVVRAVRTRTARIDRHLASYKKVNRDASGISTEGGTLRAYMSGQAIQKIEATFFRETGRTVIQDYFFNGHPIFVFERIGYYDKPLSGHTKRTDENRYYFDNGHLVEWIGPGGKAISPGDPLFAQSETQVLKDVRQFIAIARKPK